MMIEARGLSKTFMSGGQPLNVLREVDLDIEAEAFVAIVGPSGSGKTTLLGLLAGLDHPTTGSVRLDGQDLDPLTEDERAVFRATKVGFVFQTFHLLPTLTALENVMVPLELLGLREMPDGTPIAARAIDLLSRVGLDERLDHYPVQLSGGEKQRVALARAFANEPVLLFADEPTGSLDTETGSRVIRLLEELNGEARTTLVLVTHDPAVADRADRIIRLSAGVVVADDRRGPAQEGVSAVPLAHGPSS